MLTSGAINSVVPQKVEVLTFQAMFDLHDPKSINLI